MMMMITEPYIILSLVDEFLWNALRSIVQELEEIHVLAASKSPRADTY